MEHDKTYAKWYNTIMKNLFEQVVETIIDFMESTDNDSELARAIGVSPSTIQRWRKGTRKNLRFSEVARLIELMGGKVVFPAKTCSMPHSNTEVKALLEQIAQLQQEVQTLTVYKNKWEGHLEVERLKYGAGSRPATQGSLLNDLREKAAG